MPSAQFLSSATLSKILGKKSESGFVFFIGFTSVYVYKMHFTLSFAMLLYTLPIMYFTLLMLDTDWRIKTYLDVSAGLYFITVVVLLIKIQHGSCS